MIAFTALADPTRFKIVEMLANSGPLPASQISRRFPVSAPAISQHLRVLRDANLVRMKVQGQKRIYSVDPEGIQSIESWVAKMRRQWEERFDALDELLKEDATKQRGAKE